MTVPPSENFGQRSLQMHHDHQGKLEVRSKVPLRTLDDLSLAYTPGVGQVSQELANNPERSYELTWRGNTVAVVSDGSAVLGLGNLGPLGALPVMEGKCILFKELGEVNAVPIVLDTQDTDALVNIVTNLAPSFGGINLEDISAPRCFEVEDRLQDIGIPVFHDDQHGTAIVVLAGLMNALKVVNKPLTGVRIVVSGAGASAIACAKMLALAGATNTVLVDRQGAIHLERSDLTAPKQEIARLMNPGGLTGDVHQVLEGADVFLGLSGPGLLNADDIRRMAPDPVVFAMANPVPEIMPDEAFAGGAAVVATGRSDFPNQVNNVLAFPGIFRGALSVRAPRITPEMRMAAAVALAEMVEEPHAKEILPSALDRSVAVRIGEAAAAVYR